MNPEKPSLPAIIGGAVLWLLLIFVGTLIFTWVWGYWVPTPWELHAKDCPTCGRFLRHERTTEEIVACTSCVCDEGKKLYSRTDAERAAANPDWREVPDELYKKYHDVDFKKTYDKYWETHKRPEPTPGSPGSSGVTRRGWRSWTSG